MRTFIAFCISTLIALPVAAQSTCNANGTDSNCSTGSFVISIAIGRAVQLDLSSASTALTPPSAADFNAGFAATTGPSGVVRANAPWTLAISAAAPTWTAADTQTEPARTNKPSTDLSWSLAAGGPFTDLTTTPVTVAGGNVTTGLGGTLYYRTRYNWTLDTPGNYSIQVVFTLVAP